MRKAHREGAETIARPPAPAADELVEGGVQHRRVGGQPERLVAVTAKPDHRPRPACGIVGIAGQVAPHDDAGLLSEPPRKGLVDSNKSVLNELLDLRSAERARLFAFAGHEILNIVRSIAAARAKRGRQACSSSAAHQGAGGRRQRLRKKTEAISKVIIMVRVR